MPLRLSFMTIRPRLTSLFCIVLGMAIGMFLNSKSGLSVKDDHAFVTYVRDFPTTISRTVTPASFIPTPQIEEEPKQVTGGIKMATAVHDNVAEADDLNFPLDKSQELILFPYDKFSRYGLEWKGIVEELMWADKETDGTTSPGDKPFLIGDGTLGLTSVNSSRIYLKGNRTIFSRGELIHLVIEAKDEKGRARGRGGDFFFAVLSNDIKHQRTAGRVFDHGNGTYDVYFHAAWTGAASITVMLYFTREAVHWLNTQVRGQEDRIAWKGIYTLDPENSEKGEYSFCHIVNEGTWENECEYRNPVSIGKTVFLCERPKNFQCEDMYALVGDVDGLNIRAAQMINESYNMKIFSRDYIKASFAANPIKLQINKPVDGVPIKNGIPELPLCDADLPVPISDGFWRDKMVYEYSSCKATQFSDQEIFQCLENRHLWFCGDSTMRQWYNMLLFILTGRQKFRYAKSDITTGKNTTTYIFSHGLRTGRNAGNISHLTFEADIIDRIALTESCNSAVMVMNINYHFLSWSTRAYIERLLHGRKAVVRLLSRCPGAKMMIKMTHPRDNEDLMQTVHSSNWVLYDINRIVRRIFGGLGVHFIDIWDMSLSHISPDNIHMPREDVITQQLMLYLSHICPEMAANNAKHIADGNGKFKHY